MRAFDEIYAEEHPKAICYARNLFWGAKRKDDEADQIVADAFFNLYLIMKSGHQILTPTAWLCTAIQKLHAELLRRSYRVKRGKHQAPLSLTYDTGLATDDPRFEAIDNIDLLRFAWTRLTEIERKITETVFMQGIPQNKAAKQLGVSRRTFERQVQRVRQRLRTLLSIPSTREEHLNAQTRRSL